MISDYTELLITNKFFPPSNFFDAAYLKSLAGFDNLYKLGGL